MLLGSKGHLGLVHPAPKALHGEGGGPDAAEGAVTEGGAFPSTQDRDFSGPGLLRAGGLTHPLCERFNVLDVSPPISQTLPATLCVPDPGALSEPSWQDCFPGGQGGS